MIPPNPDYPVRLDVDYPDSLSRLLIFVKWLLAIPHFIALIFLAIGAYIVLFISWFAVLITGTYPEGMFNYMVGVIRWSTRVQAYVFLMTDVYPPFSLDDDPNYPVRVQIDYPSTIPRWLPLVSWLLVIPYLICAAFLLFAAEVAVFIAWFAILITGRFPEGIFSFVTITFRWALRAGAYAYWMEEPYPPFVWA
jgi:Domain of unknown function (DUF4389)